MYDESTDVSRMAIKYVLGYEYERQGESHDYAPANYKGQFGRFLTIIAQTTDFKTKMSAIPLIP